MKYKLTMKMMFPDIDPQRAGARLEHLIERHDELFTEEEFLADARKPSSPLHKIFEWSNSAAAEKYRVHQARRFLKHLIVEGRGTGGRKKTQAFVYVKHPKHGGKRVIMGVRTMVGTPEFRRQIVERRLEAGLKSLKGWLMEYGGSEEFRSIRTQAERMRKAIEKELLTCVIPRDRINQLTLKPKKLARAA